MGARLRPALLATSATALCALALLSCGVRVDSAGFVPAAIPTPAPTQTAEGTKATPFAIEAESLFDYRTAEIESLTNEQVEKKNADDIEAISRYRPGVRQSTNSGGEITAETAANLVYAIADNPVVNPWSPKYNQETVRIGYCFGRATFVHIALKKLALQTSSIRKVWLVGPMDAGGVKWGFHVATAAFVKDNGWMILDSNLGRPVDVRAWYDYYRSKSLDNRLRIYFTMPNRFGVTIAEYSRVDMGLDLTAAEDWYKHYFVDMMAWFRTADFAAMGLKRAEPAPATIPASGL